MRTPEPAPENPPDDEITRYALAARAGDPRAATQFVQATHHHLRRFVVHLSGQRDADDLTQEVYLRAMRALPSFIGRSTARTWLFAIARNTCADFVRAQARRPRIADVADWQAAIDAHQLRTEPSTDIAAGVELTELIRQLPADRRDAFVATQIAGLSYAEAAEVCGCPIGTVRSRVARAREDIVVAMNDEAVRRGRLRPSS